MNGGQLDRLSLLLVGLPVLLLLFAALRRSPRFSFLAWILAVCFIPVWKGVSVGPYFSVFAILGILGALSLLPLPRLTRPAGADALLVGVALIVALEAAFGLTTRSGAFDLLVTWTSAYLFGRFLPVVVEPDWIYGVVGIVGAVVGSLAVVEYLTGHNLFVEHFGNGSRLFSTWGTLQPRGTAIRAEGAFGHSLSLGISLGIFACLALGSRLDPALKTTVVLLCAAGSLVSLSRSGILTTVLGIVLTTILLRGRLSRAYRALVLALLALGAAVSYAFVQRTFASSDEAEGSALYRGALLELVGSMRPFGLTGDYSVSTTREASVGSFGSIDNAVLLFGLIYGWFPLLIVLVVAAAGVVTVVARRATPATIAAVAQLPALFTVALITQYAVVAWFTVGLAVATQVLRREHGTDDAAPDPLDNQSRLEIDSAHA